MAIVKCLVPGVETPHWCGTDATNPPDDMARAVGCPYPTLDGSVAAHPHWDRVGENKKKHRLIPHMRGLEPLQTRRGEAGTPLNGRWRTLPGTEPNNRALSEAVAVHIFTVRSNFNG